MHCSSVQAISAGFRAFGDTENEAFVDAVRTVLNEAHAEDTAVGVFEPHVESIDDRISLGFDFVVAGKDTLHLWEGASDVNDAFTAAVRSTK